jgi:transcriptional regulator of acetoin/glycerol metabolism
MTPLTADKIRAALTLSGGNVSEAARTLGVSRVTVYKWMKRWGITIERVAA